MKHVYVALILLLALCVLVGRIRIPNLGVETTNKLGTTQHYTIRAPPHTNNDTATIRLGELPGYTGWARPATSLAKDVQLTRIDRVDHVVVIVLEAPSAHMVFDGRAYGPAMLPGLVTSHGNGTYAVSFAAFDPGTYTVEIVVAYSQAPRLDLLPNNNNEPLTPYEGYLIPGFPLSIEVDVPRLTSDRLCTMQDLVDTTGNSALEKGRWVVRRKNVDEDYTGNNGIDLRGYQSIYNSLGIQMEYVPTQCRLPTLESLKTGAMVVKRRKPIKVIFIGDSNIDWQRVSFQKFFGSDVAWVYLQTNGGLAKKLPLIQSQLNGLARHDTDNYVLFNAGLHELDLLCHGGGDYKELQSQENFTCMEHYSKVLIPQFVETILRFPARLRVWESTTASWPKWGNFGFAWPPDVGQLFPKAPQACQAFNDLAWDVVKSYNLPVLDAYWHTLARPDHRQVQPGNAIGARMVHAGPEVYDNLMIQWATMIQEDLQKNG